MARIEELVVEVQKISERMNDKIKKIEEIEKKIIEFEKFLEEKKEAETRKAVADSIKNYQTLDEVLARPPVDDVEKRIHELADGVMLLTLVDKDRVKDSAVYKELLSYVKKSDVINTSDDSVLFPTRYSWSFFASLYKDAVLLDIFTQYTMKAQKERFPFPTTMPSVYLAGEATTTSGASYIASKPAWTYADIEAKNFKVAVPFSEIAQLFADASVVTYVRNEIAKAARLGVEWAIIDGDPDGDLGDSDLKDADDVRKAFKGLRALSKATYSTYTDISGATTIGDIHKLLVKKIFPAYANPSELVYILSPAGFANFVTDSDVKTVAQYGEKATVITGEVAKVYGVPVVVSTKVRSDLNGNGIYDGSTTSYTVVILAAPKRFVLGKVQNVNVEIVRKPLEGLNFFLCSFYAGFTPVTSTSAAPVAVGYGYSA